MTEEILNQLKSNVKELVKFLKEHDLTSANINLSALGDLTICNVKYSNETECQESFTYFFDNKDFKYEEKDNLDNSNQSIQKNISLDILKDEMIEKNISVESNKPDTISSIDKDIDKSFDKSSDTQNSELNKGTSLLNSSDIHEVGDKTEAEDGDGTTNSDLDKGMIEPYFQESLILDDEPTEEKDSTLESKSEVNQNLEATTKENIKEDTSNNNSSNNIASNNTRLINFKEENDFQKKTIMKILKEHNVLT